MITIDKRTKVEQLRDNLRAMLLTGDFVAGDRFYTESRLAKMFAVAQLTINKVMTLLESEGLLERIQGKGSFVTNSVETLRKQQGLNKTTNLALISDFYPGDIRNQKVIFSQFINLIDDQAREQRGKITVFNIANQERFAPELLHELGSGDYDGIILVHLQTQDIHSAVPQLLEKVSVPVVYGDRACSLVDSIEYDHDWIGWRGADYLMELGHQDLAFLGFETDMDWVGMRIDGFSRACSENTRSCRSSRTFTIEHSLYGTEHLQKQEIAEIFDDLAATSTGVMCANDHLAALLLEVAEEHHIQVPEQLSLLGVDDDFKLRERNLTTFRFSGEELARVAMKALQSRIENDSSAAPTIQLIKPRLLERATTSIHSASNS